MLSSQYSVTAKIAMRYKQAKIVQHKSQINHFFHFLGKKRNPFISQPAKHQMLMMFSIPTVN